jgi:hypothetical protein
MARLPLHNVRLLSLREIAEMWALEVNAPQSTILRELRIAVLNLPRWQAGEPLLAEEDIPPDDELPDPKERVNREWLMRFCDKQGWRQPYFWASGGPAARRAHVGRPAYLHFEQIFDELRRRAEAGEMEATKIAESKYLNTWARQTFPGDEPPVPETIAQRISNLYDELRVNRQN